MSDPADVDDSSDVVDDEDSEFGGGRATPDGSGSEHGPESGSASDSGSESGSNSSSDASPIEPTYSGHGDRPHLSPVQRQQTPYTESQVIMSTVKMVSPFVFTFGLFVTFHGGGSPGGGFQGGAIVAAVVLMIAFAFGIDSTREWFRNATAIGLGVGGVLIFAGIGIVGLARGGTFLEYARLPIPHPVKYGMEGIEIFGIAPIVAGVLVGLFFLLAAGFDADVEAETDGRNGTLRFEQPTADDRENTNVREPTEETEE
ncbi:MnhB domain-containing protein [Halopenitus sp. H-Gu1]|uniref:MnhB domain-containing protein n=1 Tax=Halopenitus sp. H-Gu1 TaxID=3242697 RepID=UPI00359DEF1C